MRATKPLSSTSLHPGVVLTNLLAQKSAELAEQNSGSDKVIFLKVDVDECEETAAKCGIQAMPTFKVFKNNSTDAVEEMVGANEAKLRELVAKYAQ